MHEVCCRGISAVIYDADAYCLLLSAAREAEHRHENYREKQAEKNRAAITQENFQEHDGQVALLRGQDQLLPLFPESMAGEHQKNILEVTMQWRLGRFRGMFQNQFLRRTFSNDLAVIHDGDAIAQLFRFFHVVRC